VEEGPVIGALKRAMYRQGRPNAFARLINRLDIMAYGSRVLPLRRIAVLKVVGRHSGRVTSVPVAVTRHRGAEYLVSMLGPEANWVRNLRAAGGTGVLRRRGRETPITLEEVPPEHRAEILRRYLAIAPGARPHVRLRPTAPLTAFHAVATRHPTFRIVERMSSSDPS
jgi:deazaflavin-dependent oxidoreductase (nitroreductase family)